MDRRQQKTKKLILSAFSLLLSQKSYNRITVQDIIDEANIGRSTFYAHFDTRDDLLRSMCEEIFEHVFSDNLDTERTHDFSYFNSETHSMITHILYHLRDNKNEIINLFKGESREVFVNYFKSYLNEHVIDRFLFDKYASNSTVRIDFLKNHISGSFVEMVYWWIKDDMNKSPEEISNYYMIVMSSLL